MIYTHGKHEIELFDSIHNLPILRFQRFNKYQMIACEVGNTLSDYDQRMSKALQFMQKGMKDEAIQELENCRQTVFNALNEFTPSGKSFAMLVKRIDGKVYDTFSPDDLDRCLIHLEQIGLGTADAIAKLREVKKKIETELVVYYPVFFPKNGNKEQTILRVKRMNVLLDQVIENREDPSDELFDVEKEILENDKPNIWNVWKTGNMERVLEVDFQKFAISVMKHTGQVLDNMTTFTFYASVDLLKEETKTSKKR
jgi:hypothetical protein